MLNVTTPADDFKLISVVDARAALGIPDGSEDEALGAFIVRASDVIARHCRRVIALETVAQTLRIDRYRDDLVLARYPVTAIASVTENDTAVDAADYELNPDSGLVSRLRNDRLAWWPTGKIVVTYSAGYTLPDDTPGALAQACLQLVKAYYLGADRDPMLRSETVEALSSASYYGAAVEHLPPDVRGLLAPFRSVRLW